jgi:hypothetical protein
MAGLVVAVEGGGVLVHLVHNLLLEIVSSTI